MHRIGNDVIGYHLVISTLNFDTISEVSDIIRSPPETDKYIALKTAIISRLTKSPDTQLYKLLTYVELGDTRSSHLCVTSVLLCFCMYVSDDVFLLKWLAVETSTPAAH